mmetsp:Transcript_16534/g.37971  ORF Transcript_16534/g.37971 Transcript_16534/m.37971 type:complete len:90 (-) Transcript_16534:1326-1595(-)
MAERSTVEITKLLWLRVVEAVSDLDKSLAKLDDSTSETSPQLSSDLITSRKKSVVTSFSNLSLFLSEQDFHNSFLFTVEKLLSDSKTYL